MLTAHSSTKKIFIYSMQTDSSYQHENRTYITKDLRQETMNERERGNEHLRQL